MKMLFFTLAQKLAYLRRTFLHALCFSSFAAVALGWLYLDRFGPIGVMLPAVLAIGASLSEIDRLMEPGYVRRTLKRRGSVPDRTTVKAG